MCRSKFRTDFYLSNLDLMYLLKLALIFRINQREHKFRNVHARGAIKPHSSCVWHTLFTRQIIELMDTNLYFERQHPPRKYHPHRTVGHYNTIAVCRESNWSRTFPTKKYYIWWMQLLIGI